MRRYVMGNLCLTYSSRALRFARPWRAKNAFGALDRANQQRQRTERGVVREVMGAMPLPPPLPSVLAFSPIHVAQDRPSVFVIASVVAGLPIILWAYKCMMLVLFQRKIIYMGYVPLGSRHEEVATSVSKEFFAGISCTEISIPSDDNVTLAGILVQSQTARTVGSAPKTVVIYLQGNAGNPLHRLPIFQRLLQPALSGLPSNSTEDLVVVAVSPRSYWKSTHKRPTEQGILKDYSHVLHDTLSRFPSAEIILYGHSLGGAAAICLLSQLIATQDTHQHTETITHQGHYDRIKGLIVENPFASIPGMVRALYPDRWVPYRYLAPLAFDKWDAAEALRTCTSPATPSNPHKDTVLKRLAPTMLVLLSENDEIVPPEMGTQLYDLARPLSGSSSGVRSARKVIIPNALHDNAWTKRQWLPEVLRYLAASRI